MSKEPIIKIVSKDMFVKAKAKGNYGDVSPEAQIVIDGATKFDLLELHTEMGSALKVLNAKKIDENRFCEVIRA